MMLESTAFPALPTRELDPDLELVRRIASGDRDAHRRLYERYGREVLAYLIGRLGDRHAAEELLQDVMVDAWRSAERFRGDSRVRTWLLAIAHHRACNEIRRQRRIVLSDDPDAAAAAQRRNGTTDGRGAWRGDDMIDLDRAVEALADIHRAVLDLVFYHGLSIEETAAVLEVAPGTVKSRLSRAKAQLRAELSVEAANHV